MSDSEEKKANELLYIISHDLGAPLRHIREFSKLLMKSLDDGRLNDKEKTYSDFVQGAVEDAESMISDLLKLSRLETIKREFEPFKVISLIEDVIKKLELKSKVEILVDTNLEIIADKGRIKTLFNELISNSEKFGKESPENKISISSNLDSKSLTFSIADQGIGSINLGKKEDVFNVFKKLVAKEQFKGNGIGLALCKKIVENHEGKIWLEKSDENGSEFKFSLPAKIVCKK